MIMTNKIFTALVIGTLTSLSAPVWANDAQAPNRVAHYTAQKAGSIDETLVNLREANAKLKSLLAGEVGEYDIHDIHSLSYTLEESLARLAEEIKQLHNTVADMHFASEGLNRDAVIDYGEAYLSGIGKIVQ